MDKKGLLTVLVGVVIIVSSLLILSACQDKGVDPPVVQPTEYPFYFYQSDILGVGYSTVWKYYPDQRRLDSVRVPSFYAEFTSLSADGQTMYLTDLDATYTLDLNSYEMSSFWTEPKIVFPSSDGRYLALFWRGLTLIDALTSEVLYTDTTLLNRHGNFSSDCNALYSASSEDNYIYILSIDDGMSVEKRYFDNDIYSITPSTDESLLFFSTFSNKCFEWFTTYDLASDSILIYKDINPGYLNASMQINPNNDNVWFTASGPGFSDPNDNCSDEIWSVQLFNTQNFQFNEISTVGYYGNDSTLDSLLPRNLAMSPDAKWLVGADSVDRLFLINVPNQQVEAFERFPNSGFLKNPMCQLKK